MAEQRTGAYNNPNKFNGKELDEETGFYYYGARYYDPRTSLWLSVDPLAEQTLDPYGYCYNNPINLIDPSGMSPEREPPTWILVGSIQEGKMNLKAGKGASAGSLASEWNISQKKAEQILFNNGISTNVNSKGNRVSNVKKGDIINYFAPMKETPKQPNQNLVSNKITPKNNKETKADGRAFSLGLSGNCTFIVGGELELGVVFDDDGEWGIYSSGKFKLGFDIGISGNLQGIQANDGHFDLEDFEGEGNSYTGSYGFGHTFGGSDGSEGLDYLDFNPNNFGTGKKEGNYETGGIILGKPGFSFSHGKTKLLYQSK